MKLFRTWRELYTVVLMVLFFQIIVFYLITQFYA